MFIYFSVLREGICHHFSDLVLFLRIGQNQVFLMIGYESEFEINERAYYVSKYIEGSLLNFCIIALNERRFLELLFDFSRENKTHLMIE